MRFHFGFSKFIKPSKLLYWLGLGFLMLLGFFGLTDHAFAQTLHDATNVNLGSYINSYFIDYWAKSSRDGPFGNLQSSTQNISWSSDYYGFDAKNTLVATSTYYNAFRHIEYDINTNVCSSVSGSKSIDLYFLVGSRSFTYISDILTNLGFSNITSPSDIQSIGITPIFSGDGPFAEYSCNISDFEPNVQYPSWGTYTIACIGIPTENVLGYKISYYNNLAYNFEPQELNKNIYSDQPYMLYNIPRKYDYACSDVEPVRPDQPLFPEDTTGSSNIIVNSGSSGGHDIEVSQDDGFGFANGLINSFTIPPSIYDLITLPYRFMQQILDSSGSTCTPLQLDFSSITRRWGGTDYVLQIPCMRGYLSTLLNYNLVGTLTFYNFVDIALATFLSFKLGKKIVDIISDILSGDDTTRYFTD